MSQQPARRTTGPGIAATAEPPRPAEATGATGATARAGAGPSGAGGGGGTGDGSAAGGADSRPGDASSTPNADRISDPGRISDAGRTSEASGGPDPDRITDAGRTPGVSRPPDLDHISDPDRISDAGRTPDAAAAETPAGVGEPVQGARAERVLAGPPSDYRLAVPDGWERIVLDPDRWAARIERLVARQFRGIDDQPRLRRQITDQMTDRAAAAHANGGVEMYLSLAEVGGVPLPAGLVVTVVAPDDGGALPDLETIGIARGAEGADVGMLDLPAGPALRHRYRDAPRENDPTGNKMPVTHLDFEIAIPNSPLHLLLSFSTSMDPLADVLVELFDTIATTLQWMWMP